MSTDTEYFTYHLHTCNPRTGEKSSDNYTVPVHIDFLKLVHDLLLLPPYADKYGRLEAFGRGPTPAELAQKINTGEELGDYESQYVGYLLAQADAQACEQVQEFLLSDRTGDDVPPGDYTSSQEPLSSTNFVDGIVVWRDLLAKSGALWITSPVRRFTLYVV